MPAFRQASINSIVSAIAIIPAMVPEPCHVLLLGGIKEAAELAAMLAARGHKVTTSLAGRTKEPKPVAGQIRIGGFGGAAGLAAYLRNNNIEIIIDATHPFAKQISLNACEAATQSGTPLIIFQRPLWRKQAGDNWHIVPNIEAACTAIPQNATVLLALGRQHIAPFAMREDVRFIIRMVDAPEVALPFKNHQLILGLPPTKPEAEATLFKAHGITHILCRNSGGQGAYAKIEAARQLGLPVIMIDRA